VDSIIFEVEDESKVFQIPPNNSVEIQSILGKVDGRVIKRKKRVVYSEKLIFHSVAQPMTIKLNMHTARLTEGGKPIKKANNHKNKITLIDRNKYPYLSFPRVLKQSIGIRQLSQYGVLKERVDE